MGNEGEAFDLVLLARKLTSDAAVNRPAALTWYTPVRFDPTLLKKLLDGHDALDARLASLPNRLRRDRDEAWRMTQACADQLHDLRRQEALWIYPVIAHGLAADASARRKLLNLRFLMNSLARRVLRSIEDLARLVRQAADINAALTAVTGSLAEYRQRNESDLYTLYSLMDPRKLASSAAVTGSR
jgi:hypothetical protein